MSGSRVPWSRALLAALLLLSGCEYLRMLRPAVLKQLTPGTVRLVNYLPNVDQPNEAVLGRLFAQGGLSHARVHPDGVMRDRMRVRLQSVVWEPSILVMARPGTLELEVANEDELAHVAYFPDGDGTEEVLVLPPRTAGRVRITLDGPGMYTFADGVSNAAGQGMIGIILVEGDVPAHARLQRSPQPRPRR